jgi:phage tail sheath protein FI
MNNAISFRNSLTSSSYLVIDTGYKYRYDKYNDTYRWVPLNGDIAGLAARVEPWESPAGYKRGVIKNVVKLAFNPNKAQRDQLYGSDINPVISQVGQGVLLFGDKTALGTATGSAFTRINVRRLFITVEKAIATVAASFLFDFNDEFTQTQFKNLVEPFLRDIQGRRGIIDFRVVSDATVNTPDVVDRNIFRGNIFIKPARSINVIELTFVATRTGVEFDEIVGQPL